MQWWDYVMVVGVLLIGTSAFVALSAYMGRGLSQEELPRVFRTGNLRLFHAASCPFRYSSRTSCGVRYPSVEWRRVLL